MKQEVCSSTILELIKRQSEQNPDAFCLMADGRQPLKYARLQDHMQEIVRQFRALGIRKNDRIAVVLPNGPEMAVAFMAVASCAACAPLNPDYASEEFQFYLSDLNAKALIVDSENHSSAETIAQHLGIPVLRLQPEQNAEAGICKLIVAETTGSSGRAPRAPTELAQADDVALVLHTSGTTSRPKLVPLTHKNLIASASNIQASLALAGSDRCLNLMPLFHIHGLIGALLSSFVAGATVVCTPGFYAVKFFDWMEQFQPTWYTAVPTIHQAILSRAPSYLEVIAHSSLRFIRSSSAALPAKTMTELENVFSAPVIEAYGMTEAAHQITSNPLPPGKRKPGSVGIATGTEVAILDDHNHLLPRGESGEIAIRGGNVTNGYEYRESPAEARSPSDWFRTGDEGFVDVDGYLHITGRIKEIINRGGEKISPRQIDEALLEHPAIVQAVAFGFPDARLGEDVGAAVVIRQDSYASEREIREFVASRLANFKVPRKICFLRQIPLGPTGKIQRAKLAEVLGVTGDSETELQASMDLTPPQSATQETLKRIWLDLLKIKDVGINANFFHVGGDSVLAAQFNSRVRHLLNVQLSLIALFEEPTIAGIAQLIDAAGQKETLTRIRPHSLPTMSDMQIRLWFFDQLERGSSVYNRPVIKRIKSRLDISLLERSLNRIVQRHETLRSTLATVEGSPSLRIISKVSLPLTVVDLSDLTTAERESTARFQCVEKIKKPMDIATGPLLHATLFRLADNDYVLLIVVSHIVFDFWSEEILLNELLSIYDALSTGNRLLLDPLPVQYSDFAFWQERHLKGGVLEQLLGYWERQLDAAPLVLQLRKQKPRAAHSSYNAATKNLLLSSELTGSLKMLARREGVTLFMTFVAAFQALLRLNSEQTDILVGTPVSGRNHVEVERLIGCFINMVVLRCDLSGSLSFSELFKRVRAATLGALAHQDLPFGKLVAAVRCKRELNLNPIFQVTIQVRNSSTRTYPARLEIEDFEIGSPTNAFDLSLDIRDVSQGMLCRMIYKTDLFESDYVDGLLQQFHELLQRMVLDPAQALS